MRGRWWFAFASVAFVACSSFQAQDPPDDGDGGTKGDTGVVPDSGRILSCPEGARLLGQIATLGGKVNTHTPATATDDDVNRARAVNGWLPDRDCSTGDNVDPLAYCRRFWSATETFVDAGIGPTLKPFLPAGCTPFEPLTGRNEFLCCGQAL